jgi:pumilio RNA-binding family
VLTPSQRDVLVNEVKPKVSECIEDSNGNHVIQKIVESIPSEKVQFIIDCFRDRVYEMSVH